MAGGGVERAIGTCGYAPDYGLFGSEKRIEFWGEGQAAITPEGNAVEFSFDEIGEAGHFPGGGGGGEERDCEREKEYG
jgi:hypothetical protein